ncbi:MAG: ATP-dependent Clp protease ATP-binding subunit ClpX, partial [Planctomycetaceae bacterium]|nr:ATP-dependent Clp protease ATP-binding subunit ClpX [Planctomycetaceae bacterium]
LGEKDLVKILVEPKNSIVRQYQQLFAMENAKLDFTEDALREIARVAAQRETGARSLRSVLEGVIFDLLFELPDQGNGKTYVITPEMVRGEQVVRSVEDSAAA